MAAKTIRAQVGKARSGLASEQVCRAVARASLGLGVSLWTMFNPAAAQARVPVPLHEETR